MNVIISSTPRLQNSLFTAGFTTKTLHVFLFSLIYATFCTRFPLQLIVLIIFVHDYTSRSFSLRIYTRLLLGLRCATNRKVASSIPSGVSGFFIDIKSFRLHYGAGVDSASNRNEYQEYFFGIKAAGA